MQCIYCNGHVIHFRYLQNRKQTTLLFINSLGTDLRLWDELIRDLVLHANLLFYDKRGHGLSGFAKADRGLEDYAEDAWQLLSKLSITKCIPVGLSVGGMIAQLLASHHPDAVQKLVLCATATKIGNPEIWNERISRVSATGLKSISESLMKRWFGAVFLSEQTEKVACFQNMLERCSPDGYIQAVESIRDGDTGYAAARLTMPVLCIVGSEDQSTSPQQVHALADQIPKAQIVTIRGSAHLPCVDNPTEFINQIVDFIS